MGALYRRATRTRDPHAEGFAVVGPKGAVEVWRFAGPEAAIRISGEWLGGVEYHSRSPQHEGQEVSHGDCELIGDCYHDGSSLALDYFAQRGLWGEAVYPELEDRYRGHFGGDEA